ncbi:hypothetical protein HYDPIDRAFT_115868 [Hydnomerulius pinastri MD-312]|uniref:Uncharacterized protein n=1 Tax=Hydnomerulius pinastri MD-312 TaxID=994086 RepID=A0A0C9V6Z2_9AGAM|nr:hypothetical protein HYDPIDRAFT_115868 [Hydnomerulius pinastri MD-312]
MLPFALKVVWFCLSFTGTIGCWVVLTIFARAIGSYWGPMLYSVFATILQGIFCLGMVYDMNPFQMPKTFCVAQTFIIYYAAWSLTGVCAAFTFATTGSVLWPSTMISTAASTLAWNNKYYIPIVMFPLTCLAVSVPVLLKLDAIQPTNDLHCDASNPIWGRFLGYAGLSMLLTIPCFFLSAAAALRVLRMHLGNQRPTAVFQNTSIRSHSHSRFRSGSGGRVPTHECTSPLSSPNHDSTVKSYLDPEVEAEVDERRYAHKKGLPRLITDDDVLAHTDDAYELNGTCSHVLPSPVFASPSSSQKVPQKWDLITTTREPDDDPDSPQRQTTSIPLPTGTMATYRPSKPNLAPAIWRLILFQVAFFTIQCLAALSTIVDVAQHRETPTPFGTQHVALILVGWGPSVVFGHLPAVRRQLMFWRRSPP